MVESISTLGLQHVTTNNLINGQALLSKLSEQLTTGIYSSNLSDYSSSAAQKLLNFNGKVDEQNGFLSVINTISPRISAYDSALTGIEDTVSSATSTLLGSSTYNSATNSSLQTAIKGYMDDMAYYLNQKVGDRYIFSGTRYDQEPVIGSDAMIALPSPPTETAPYVATPPAVPAYDTNYNPTAAATFATGSIQDGIDLTAVTAGEGSNDVQLTITSDAGPPVTYGATLTDVSTGVTETYSGYDAATFWSSLETDLGSSALATGAVTTGTADVTTMVGSVTVLSGGADATSVDDPYPSAYVEDSVRIDTNKMLTYGVTSDDASFQQVIMGLRFAYAATQDPDNYATLMDTAQSLLATGLANVRGVHTGVTNANTTLSNTKSTITTNISNLNDQVDNIENVDLNEVGVKITVLQAQLEASYAATAKLAKLSILDYL